MDIKSIIARLVKGEAVTDEEKLALAAYDPDSVAAAARRKAEEAANAYKTQQDELAKKLEEANSAKMTDKQRWEQHLAQLTASMEQMRQEKAKADAEIRAANRRQALNELRQREGIGFVNGVNPRLAQSAWESAFDGVDDFASPEVALRINTFRAENSALISDNTGQGTGMQGRPIGVKPGAPQSDADRQDKLQMMIKSIKL